MQVAGGGGGGGSDRIEANTLRHSRDSKAAIKM